MNLTYVLCINFEYDVHPLPEYGSLIRYISKAVSDFSRLEEAPAFGPCFA
jgi:hypothetical protein